MLIREKTTEPQIASYVPPIVELANSTIKQSITAQPPDVPMIAAPVLYGTPQQKQETLIKLNTDELKKPTEQQVVFIPQSLYTAPIDTIGVGVPDLNPTPIITPVKSPTVSISSAPVLITSPIIAKKQTEIIPAPINKVSITQPVFDKLQIARRQTAKPQTGQEFKINPIYIIVGIGAAALIYITTKKKR